MPSALLKPFRVLVVDDEQPARQRLIDLMRRDPQEAGILEAADGLAAVQAIRTYQPDLIFLDVQMPELDGLGVIREVGAQNMPLTVFVTAYDQHAISAFEANALDYLLKPFSDERFEATMARVKARMDELSLRDFGQRIMSMAATTSATTTPAPSDQSAHAPNPDSGHPPFDRLVVKSGGTTRFIRVADIDWIEAAGVYVNLHVGGRELLYRSVLNDLAARLDPRRFVRVHRSAIVNIESILHLEPISHGEFEVVLKNGSRPRVSRTYRPHLEKRLGQPL